MNGSKYELKETLRPNLEGLEVVHPSLTGDEGIDVEIELPAGQDHIVILRRTQSSCTYGMQYLTHPREFTDEEIQQQTQELGEDDTNYFGNQNDAFYKLYNSTAYACFYFMNGSNFTLKATFTFGLDNLYIVGEEDAGADSFNINLAPGASCFKMLKPIEVGQQTGIQMRYEFAFQDHE